MGDSTVLEALGVTKTFDSGGRELTVLSDVSLSLEDGDTCAIVGPSGSGKTTLLGLFAGLDHPTSGEISLCGSSLKELTEDERAWLRNRNVGFVFQTFRLLPTLTALENVVVPAELAGGNNARARAEELLGAVGLAERMDHYPVQLSGGEQQRVGIARAFINSPRVLFADEPTGNLDADTGAAIEDLIFELNRVGGTTLVLVTHDRELASRMNRVLNLRGGRVQTESDDSGERPGRVISATSGS